MWSRASFLLYNHQENNHRQWWICSNKKLKGWDAGCYQKLNINEATDWCHNLVLVRKPNGKLRVCLDPRTINKALRFNVHNARTFQDVTSSIRKVTKVSKIDANSGFWTLPMDDQSQLLTMFNVPWGRYCFVKMPFGLNQAQYFFQFYMDAHFQDINSTTNVIADDIMIHGESNNQHDMHLLQVLNKCREIDWSWIQINANLERKRFSFMATLSALMEWTRSNKGRRHPQDALSKLKLELASFLGMCNYLSTYIPWLSDITTTLRQLNKKSVKFAWNPTYEKAFRQAKLHVANAVTLQYFDPGQPIVLECDASGNGVGGTLLQNGQPVISSLKLSQIHKSVTPILKGNFWPWSWLLRSSIITFLADISWFILTIHLWSVCWKMSEWHLTVTSTLDVTIVPVPNANKIHYTQVCSHHRLHVKVGQPQKWNWRSNT